jgi:hypothetical protein
LLGPTWGLNDIRPLAPITNIAADRSFMLANLQPGEYWVQLVLPRVGRASMVRYLPDKIELTADVDRAQIDTGPILSGWLAGSVSWTGATPPPGQLAIVATHPSSGFSPYDFGPFDQLVEILGPDGTFELTLPPGEYGLAIIDLLSGARVFDQRDVPTTVPPNDLALAELEVALATVHVHLEPEVPGAVVDVHVLSIESSGRREGLFAESFPREPALMGEIDLDHGQRQLVLYLPVRPLRFAVGFASDHLGPPVSQAADLALGRAEFTPTLGEVNLLRIPVKAYRER